MWVKKVRLYNFRNISDQQLELSQHVNLLIGSNGAGKTNILEGIYLLGVGRSFRTSDHKTLIKEGETSGSVFLTVNDNGVETVAGAVVSKDGKEFFLGQDKRTSFKNLLGVLKVVIFSPADLDLIFGSPAGRRRLMDKHVVDLNQYCFELLIRYNKAIRAKQVVLQSHGADFSKINTWNRLLAELAAPIITHRLELIAKVNQKLNNFSDLFLSGQPLNFSCELTSDFIDGDRALTEEEILSVLDKYTARELGARRTLLGIQRDDLVFNLGGKKAKEFASQGQARGVILATKIALAQLIEEDTGRKPLLLLDDMESELDNKRVQRFYEMVLSIGSQVIITGTHLREVEVVRDQARMINICDGALVTE